jgi:hypothetical protein
VASAGADAIEIFAANSARFGRHEKRYTLKSTIWQRNAATKAGQ